MLPTDRDNNRRRDGLIHFQLWLDSAGRQHGHGIAQYVANLRPNIIGLRISYRFVKLDTDHRLARHRTGFQLLNVRNFPQRSLDRFADQGFHAQRGCTGQKGHNHAVALGHLRIFLARQSGECGAAEHHDKQHQQGADARIGIKKVSAH